MQSYVFYRNFTEKNYLCAMHLNAITRKSAVMAVILLAVVLFTAVLRYWFAPFEIELADSASRESLLLVTLAMFIYFANGFIQGKALRRAGLSSGPCAFPIPLYGILACGIFVAPDMLAASSASMCFIVALYLLLRSIHNAEESESVFYASILLGVTVLLYPPCVVLAAVVPIAVLTLALSLRQAMIMIVGYLLPVFVASYIVWYGGGGFFDVLNNIFSTLALPHLLAVESVPYLALSMIGLVAVLLVWGLLHALFRSTKSFLMTRARMSLYFYLWVMFATLAIIFIPACDLSACAIFAVPVSILLSMILDILPNNIATISYWLLLALFATHLFVA